MVPLLPEGVDVDQAKKVSKNIVKSAVAPYAKSVKLSSSSGRAYALAMF